MTEIAPYPNARDVGQDLSAQRRRDNTRFRTAPAASYVRYDKWARGGTGVTRQDGPLHKAIRADRWLLDALLPQFPHGTINVFDGDLRSLYAAGAGHSRLGLVSMALTGRRRDDLFPAVPIARVTAYCRRAFAGQTVTFTLSIVGREYVIRAWPLAEPDGATSTTGRREPNPVAARGRHAGRRRAHEPADR